MMNECGKRLAVCKQDEEARKRFLIGNQE